VDLKDAATQGRFHETEVAKGAHSVKQLTEMNTPSELLEFTVTDEISGEDCEPFEITRKHEMHDKNWEGTD
jgi:hypothetical protein